MAAPDNPQDQNQDQTSPLREAEPESLNTLFDRDPLSLTTQEVDYIVQKMREGRERWAKEEAEKASRGKKSKPADPNMSLDDLGL